MISDSVKPDKTPTIAQQNELFRKGVLCHNIPGRIVTTRLLAKSPRYREIIDAVRAFDSFDESNDPWKEHDEAIVGDAYFKIDYYEDEELEYGSDDSSDLSMTYRVMTIAFTSEY